ncbi:MAG: hypothetical protein GY811_16050 [Myxococcales bacterium]|nr:hypothetical protein [Myxococcales bacterium]
MRYARIAIFLASIMIATGVFLPYVQLGVGGFAFGEGSSVTLYSTVSNYSFLEAASSRVDVSMAERISDGLLARAGHKSAKLSKKLREAKSALRDIREVREDAHVETLGTVLRVTGISFLGILLVVSWLVLKGLSSGVAHRRRAIVAGVLMSLVSLVAIALFFATRESLKLGNAEVRVPLLMLGSGAHVMLTGAICGLAATVATLVFELRATAAPRPVP